MKRTLLSLMLLPLAAFAEPPDSPDETKPTPTQEPTSHFELSMGFMGGDRDYRGAGFSYTGGAGGVVGGGKSLVEPLERSPFAGARVYGPAWELRQVFDRVRFTVGLQKPFTSFRLSESTSVTADGQQVGARSLSSWELRFGLGYEYQLGPVTPFVDLMGQIDWLSAELTVDQQPATYRATSFALSARGGLRIQVSKLVFVAPSAELGLTGDARWTAQLMVGLKLPFD